MLRKFNPAGVAANPNYSHIAQATGSNSITFVAGQIGTRPDNSVPDSFTEQVDLVFGKIATALESAGHGMGDIAKITAFLTDEADLADYRAAVARHLPTPPPASSLVFVKALILPALRVEVEAIAVG